MPRCTVPGSPRKLKLLLFLQTNTRVCVVGVPDLIFLDSNCFQGLLTPHVLDSC